MEFCVCVFVAGGVGGIWCSCVWLIAVVRALISLLWINCSCVCW